jgi:hypothetical protein
MPNNMKSVMIFDPKDTDEQTSNKWIDWNRHKSAVTDKYVPSAAETRKMLYD